LSWEPSSNATSYEVNLSTDPNFTSFVEGYDTTHSTTSTSIIFINLSAGTQYYFRIKAKNKDAESAYSSTDNIITIPAAAQNLISTSTGCDGCTNIEWDGSSGVTGYKLYVALDSNYSQTIADYGFKNLSSTDTTHEICNLDLGTEYYVKLISYNDCGESEASELLIETPPEIPTTRLSSQIRSNSFTATWSYPSGVSYFEFFLSEASDFSTTVSTYDGVQTFTNRIAVDGLTANVYYYKVKAYNSQNQTCGESDVRTTTLVVSAPTATAATNNNIDCTETGHTFSSTAASFTINWNAQGSATGYYVDVSETSDFTSFVTAENSSGVEIYLESYEVLGAGSNSLSVQNLSSGTLYYYRIRSFNDEGSSLDSNVITVLTKPFRPAFTTSNAASGSGLTLNFIPTFSQNTANSSTTAQEYSLNIYSDAALSNLFLTDQFTSNQVSLSNLAAGGVYYAVGIATNESGDSCESAVFEFSTSKALLKQDEFPIVQQNGDFILLEINN
jgi:hypothetical protein